MVHPPVGGYLLLQPAEAVHKGHMLFSGKQFLAVPLAVDIDEKGGYLPQQPGGGGAAVDPAAAVAPGVQFPVDHQLALLHRVAQLLHLAGHLLRDAGEKGGDHRPALAAADDAPGGPGPQHRVDGADEDGLARAGLAGKDVEAPLQLDGGLLDHRDIFDVELGKHLDPPVLKV